MRLTRLLLLSLSFTLPLAACEISNVTDIDPDAPSNLTYELIPSGDPNAPLGILLSWEPPISGRAVTFDVFGRSTAQGGWDRRATTTSPSFHDSGTPQLQYYVLARDGQGNDLGETDVVTVDQRNRLPAPAGLTSISLNRAIQLTWSSNAVDANRDVFDYYRVYSADYDGARSSCGQWSLEGSTVSDAFLATNLANGVSRCFAVSAVSRDGHESSWSGVRQDTPRFDARNVLVYARDIRADSAGFFFYDETSRQYGLVTSAARAALDFTLERHADGTLWFNPARSDVLMATYGTSAIPDLTSIDRAPQTGFASVTIEAVPGYGYVFRTKKADGTHYGALRVAYVAQNYVVFDWSYQSSAANPELSRIPTL
jgi:hypothetical protein